MGGDGDLHRLRYDTLVLALGGETATFGIPGLEEHAVGMKTLADAFSLRNRLIEMLERAELEEDPAERAAQLTFVVGGGGLLRRRDRGRGRGFRAPRAAVATTRSVPTDEVRAYLVELKDQHPARDAGRHGRLRAAGGSSRRGYQVLPRHAHQGGARGRGRHRRRASATIPTRTVIWTGGVRPAPLVARVRGRGRPRRPGGHAADDGDEPATGVFAIGDCATIPNVGRPHRPPHAPTAQNAVREAKTLAANIVARIDGGQLQPFRYRPIGHAGVASASHTGVGVVFGIRVRGLIAWFMWRGYYWSRMPGFSAQGARRASTGC